MAKERDIIVYDLETKDTFQMVGSRFAKDLHISVVGMYSYNDDEYYVYEEHELPQFFRKLENCKLLVGFTNKHFDDQVVASVFPEILKIPSFDILEQVQKALGHRLKLDNIAHATLGHGKTGYGLLAVQMYAEGRIQELKDYCLEDVKVTKEVYDFGRKHGFLKYKDLAGEREFAVDFSLADKLLKEEVAPMNLSLF